MGPAWERTPPTTGRHRESLGLPHPVIVPLSLDYRRA